VIGATAGGSAAAGGGNGSASAPAGGKLAPMGVDKENVGGGGSAGDGLRVKELERLVGDLQDKVDSDYRSKVCACVHTIGSTLGKNSYVLHPKP
jgi:hypothetical protein